MTSVLVVDDAGDLRLLMRHVLQAEGFHVLEASGGQGALDALAGEAAGADLVVLDVQMPDLDGWDTLAGIRGGVAPETAVIVCSVKSGPEDVRRAWLLGCDGYVVKPFEVGEFVEEIRAVLARRPEEREAIRAARLSE